MKNCAFGNKIVLTGRQSVTGSCRKFLNQRLHDLPCTSPAILR